VHETAAGYRFRHALVREVIYDSLSRERRAHWHARMAAALQQHESELTSGAKDAVLAHHLRAAGQLEAALPHFINAGRQAMKRIGFQEALQFFQQTTSIMNELGVREGPQRFMVLKRLGMIHFALSEVDDAVAHFDAALGVGASDDADWEPSDGDRAVVMKLAAGALITVGDLDSADALLTRARALLCSGDPQLSQLLYTIAQLRWGQGLRGTGAGLPLDGGVADGHGVDGETKGARR
jgi:tetratricopeptide (TPR) repeat protein